MTESSRLLLCLYMLYPQVVVPVYMRERKSNSNYSPPSLFGQPLLVGVPVEVSYQALYELILNRMSR
jgi:hypothetical protein